MKDPKNLLLNQYVKRRPYMEQVFRDIPIVVAKEEDMGLLGAFVYARRVVFDLYDPSADKTA
jgi:hypothetical protein